MLVLLAGVTVANVLSSKASETGNPKMSADGLGESINATVAKNNVIPLNSRLNECLGKDNLPLIVDLFTNELSAMEGLHFAGVIIHSGLKELLVDLLLLGNVRKVERELVNLCRIKEKDSRGT